MTSLVKVAVIGMIGVSLSGCLEHFSCAGWEDLPEPKVSRSDDPRTKRVVLAWREYANKMGCKFSH